MSGLSAEVYTLSNFSIIETVFKKFFFCFNLGAHYISWLDAHYIRFAVELTNSTVLILPPMRPDTQSLWSLSTTIWWDASVIKLFTTQSIVVWTRRSTFLLHNLYCMNTNVRIVRVVCMIVRVRVVLKRTIVGDLRFDNLSGSHLQRQMNSDKLYTSQSFSQYHHS